MVVFIWETILGPFVVSNLPPTPLNPAKPCAKQGHPRHLVSRLQLAVSPYSHPPASAKNASVFTQAKADILAPSV